MKLEIWLFIQTPSFPKKKLHNKINKTKIMIEIAAQSNGIGQINV